MKRTHTGRLSPSASATPSRTMAAISRQIATALTTHTGVTSAASCTGPM
jgi:hypothetical protein